jgi:hypothetical protein
VEDIRFAYSTITTRKRIGETRQRISGGEFMARIEGVAESDADDEVRQIFGQRTVGCLLLLSELQ